MQFVNIRIIPKSPYKRNKTSYLLLYQISITAITYAVSLVGVLSVCNGLGRILTGALFDSMGRRNISLYLILLWYKVFLNKYGTDDLYGYGWFSYRYCFKQNS